MPYTSHGHAYGVVDVDEPNPKLVARCGGPAICGKCAIEAGRIQPEVAAKALVAFGRDISAAFKQALERAAPAINALYEQFRAAHERDPVRFHAAMADPTACPFCTEETPR